MKTKIGNRKPKGARNWGVCLGILSLFFAFSFIFASSTNAGTFFDVRLDFAKEVEGVRNQDKDDFNDGKADGWLVFAGTWEVIDGEYHMPAEVNTPPYPTTYAFEG